MLLVCDQPGQEVTNLFREVRIVGAVTDEFAREKGTRLFLLLGAKPGFTDFFHTMATIAVEMNR